MNQNLRTHRAWQPTENRYRILLIENDLQFRLFVQTFLETLGYHVHISEDAADAIEQNANSAFDAIILNMMLPSQDGLALIENLKQANNCPPLLAMAGAEQQQEGFLSLALMQGADAVIFKPVNIEQLKQRLKMLINQYHYQLEQPKAL